MSRFVVRCATLIAISSFAAACSSSTSSSTSDTDPPTDKKFESDLVTGMHDSVEKDIETLISAAQELEAAAPTPAGRGWDAKLDAKAIADMKTAWIKARSSYERIEGVLAPLFSDLDRSIDARYDDFLSDLGSKGDTYLFDDKGVTGLHAVERILYQPETPKRVITLEESLPGYKAAAFPATAAEAKDFKDKLCAKIVVDANSFKAQWKPSNIDVGSCFQGLVSLMNEQREKVQNAASDIEESRYSQRTMADLRDNLAGTSSAYAFFQPWLRSKKDADHPERDGATIDAAILKGFDKLEATYETVDGPAIPQPPVDWSAEHPSQKDLATPFGKLWNAVQGAVNPATDGSVVDEMNDAATVLGFPPFVAGQ